MAETIDTKFLDWLLKRLENEHGPNINLPFMGVPDGTKKGGEGYSLREIVDGMRIGDSPLFQPIYKALYDQFQREYQESNQ